MEDKKRIVVRNLPYSATKESVLELFQKFGEMVDTYKPENKGFAFITFADETSASNAVSEMNGYAMEGRELIVQIAQPREERSGNSSQTETNRIFIGNVSFSTTIEEIVEEFKGFGEIKDSYKPEGKNFAFITFANAEDAQKAIAEMNGKDMGGQALEVNLARPKVRRERRDFNNRSDSRGDSRGGYNRNSYNSIF